MSPLGVEMKTVLHYWRSDSITVLCTSFLNTESVDKLQWSVSLIHCLKALLGEFEVQCNFYPKILSTVHAFELNTAHFILVVPVLWSHLLILTRMSKDIFHFSNKFYTNYEDFPTLGLRGLSYQPVLSMCCIWKLNNLAMARSVVGAIPCWCSRDATHLKVGWGHPRQTTAVCSWGYSSQ